MTATVLSKALKEAYASGAGIIYRTIELHHNTFDTPIRIVRSEEDMLFRLESTAPKDARTFQTFIALGFDIEIPELNPSSIPQMKLTIDNVDKTIVNALELAITSTALITVIYREYLANDLTEPQNDPPLKMVITEVTADPFKVTATASFPNLMNRKFPNVSYDPMVFPGLLAQ